MKYMPKVVFKDGKPRTSNDFLARQQRWIHTL
jgi:hypothetical protein